ncbi:coproporphyrinogen III oxidase family protein [Helicobacter apodemus]|uniref:Heme chaperone HemW n=1 Tax=Helicobacter apodemus TaxID=135569 RepID=A0A4U8UDQ9_9HELI|nr:radical SAM family heme chaperone HemW [Helicobacter apodemus]TLE15830.1 coproporphyrinogen III oxidase family protein [Helicobacter apodemus]
MEVALYLHIPFCDSKCGYCAFNSATNQNHLKTSYMEALHKHLQRQIQYLQISQFSSVYIGGGTPNVIDSGFYKPIFETLQPYISNNSEVNIEANPNSLTLQWLKSLKSLGVNRLSLGVQSFFDKKLQFLERIHQKDCIAKAFEVIQQAKIENVSLDLIYGTPFCTKEILELELAQASQMPINHLSAYQLSIDEGSKFFLQNKQEREGDFEEFPSMGHFIKSYLQSCGFYQYEVSNYARDYRCKHNLNYWERKPYLGVGAGAVSCINDIRSYTQKDIKTYIQEKNQDKESKEVLSPQDIELETLFLGFRSCVGVAEKKITQTKHLKILLEEKKVEKRGDKIYAKDYFLSDSLALFLQD